jgi:hypothetical protein
MKNNLAGWQGFLACGMLLFVLGACQSGPPVQEMSDARMAIAVAREAGAAQLASTQLRAAESLLNSAQRNLSERAYTQARKNAIEAKNRAFEALANAESTGNLR